MEADMNLIGKVIDSVETADGCTIQLQEPVRIVAFSLDGAGKIFTKPVKDGAYASHYKQGGVQTVDKTETVLGYLDKSDEIGAVEGERAGHMFKYFDRAGHKDDFKLDCYKCADWLHRLLTGKFLNEVGVEYE